MSKQDATNITRHDGHNEDEDEETENSATSSFADTSDDDDEPSHQNDKTNTRDDEREGTDSSQKPNISKRRGSSPRAPKWRRDRGHYYDGDRTPLPGRAQGQSRDRRTDWERSASGRRRYSAGSGGGGGFGGKRKIPPSPSPGLKWFDDYSKIDKTCGRVLMIDFLKLEHRSSFTRKVATQELYSIDALRRFYARRLRDGQQRSVDEPVLRVIHVQNADWATPFLLRRFNIDNRNDMIGSDFGKYVQYRRPERRGGKPLLNGKTWKAQYDPWRGVRKASFGLDYVKSFPTKNLTSEARTDQADRLMQLNTFNENDEPICGQNVYVQRVSCYIQHKQKASANRDQVVQHPDIDENYPVKNALKDKEEYVRQRLRTLDNNNVIIIFDNSYSNNIEDTLIVARQGWESRWRRLPFYLAFESKDAMEDDDHLAVQCTKAILDDLFSAVTTAWDGFLDHATTHVSILEDKIYDEPADETRAPELWSNSGMWLKIEKLLNVHTDLVNEMRSRLYDLTDDVQQEDNWLEELPGDFHRLNNLVTEDLVKPTDSLISLLYQSVQIRDSRHSLELGVSMWRLSWITFIFLPLTFMVGFFGMNVDTFSDDPSIKWYFVAAIPFMLAILIGYFIIKRVVSRQLQTPYQRGVYENFYQQMAATNPTLWSRNGPREYVVPNGRMAQLKWRMIRWWSAPERTIHPNLDHSGLGLGGGGPTSDDPGGEDSLGLLSRLERCLTRRWTAQIQRTLMPDVELGLQNRPSSSSSLLSPESNLNDNEGNLLLNGMFGSGSGGDADIDDHHIDHNTRTDNSNTDRNNNNNNNNNKKKKKKKKQDNEADKSIGSALIEISETAIAPAVPEDVQPPSIVVVNEPGKLAVPGSITPLPVAGSNLHADGFSIMKPITTATTSLTAESKEVGELRKTKRDGSRDSGATAKQRQEGGQVRNRSNSSNGSIMAGVLIEEEDPEWLCERGKKGKSWIWRNESERRRDAKEGISNKIKEKDDEDNEKKQTKMRRLKPRKHGDASADDSDEDIPRKIKSRRKHKQKYRDPDPQPQEGQQDEDTFGPKSQKEADSEDITGNKEKPSI